MRQHFTSVHRLIYIKWIIFFNENKNELYNYIVCSVIHCENSLDIYLINIVGRFAIIAQSRWGTFLAEKNSLVHSWGSWNIRTFWNHVHPGITCILESRTSWNHVHPGITYIHKFIPCHLSFISALPAFRKRFKHHLFSSAFPGISSLHPLTSRFVMSSNTVHECKLHQMHLAAQLTRSSWALLEHWATYWRTCKCFVTNLLEIVRLSLISEHAPRQLFDFVTCPWSQHWFTSR